MGKIYTKKGDAGTTNIHGGEVVPKDCARIEANGTLDELNALLGVVRAFNGNSHNPDKSLEDFLCRVQSVFMPMMSIVATPQQRRDANPRRFDATLVGECERIVDTLQRKLEDRKNFVHPGGTVVASLLQLSRTVARRAERRLWSLHREDPVPAEMMAFMNRLSDALFVLARYENQKNDFPEEKWEEFYQYRRRTDEKQ
ncbi:MAG: cob(I)yrinic acid a,c-diamide adenosyltransferase [Bacteroidales bacterium]|nr:cob(I)yrinic acid a,c-diamide adenosyltransferase [Bacteroidales bacterium]